ncbi:MAG: response regulator transcription factor [Clostridia bacterium]|nr:response regulator transcription factor [Clostridia bacterium]
MANMLILEPDRAQCRAMTQALKAAGHHPRAVHTVREAEKILRRERMMTILNAQISFTQSYEFVRAMAERGLPVIFVTADPANAAHLRAMYHGDCDVLLKPFDAEELTAMAERLLAQAERTLSVGSLRLDVEARQATKDGEPITLTAQEFALLEALMRSPDEAVSREDLLRSAWGYQGIGITRTVDVHVQRLRRKLGRDAIETVYKTGYRLRLA